MLDSFTADTFQPHVGETFRVASEGAEEVPIRLTSVTPWGPEQARGRQPFTLLFHGPVTPLLPQRTYTLAADAMDAFELFIVPLGPDADGMRYEAIFT